MKPQGFSKMLITLDAFRTKYNASVHRPQTDTWWQPTLYVSPNRVSGGLPSAVLVRERMGAGVKSGQEHGESSAQ